MANVIKHKRGSGSDPGASDLILGELAIRTDTGKLFTKMDSGAIAEIAGGGSDIAINTLSSSSGTGGGSATFNGSAYRFTLSAPPNVSAAQLLVSINGVIQKPVAGTGQPSEGFSVDGTDIILGDAPATGSDFFILTFKSLGVSEPADNSVTSAKIVDGAIVNADINASAAIARTKLANVDLVDDTSPQLGANLDTNGSLIIFPDSNGATNRLLFGASKFQMLYDSGNSRMSLDNNTGDMIIRNTGSGGDIDIISSDDIRIRPQGGENGINLVGDGTVELYYDSNKRFETTSAGVAVSGAITGTGDLTIDTNTLHVDSTNNRVGIGTTSPNYELQVNDPSATVSVLQLTNTTTGSGAGDGFLVYNNGLHALISNEEAGDLRLQTSGLQRLTIDSSGNVGINTNGPSRRLNLNIGGDQTWFQIDKSRAANEAMLQLVHTAGNRPAAIRYANSQGSWKTGIDGTEAFVIASGATDVGDGTPRMTIDSSGRLIVGATSGAGKFIVQDSSLPKIQANFNGTAHLESGVGGSGGGFAITTGHFLTFNHQPYANRGTDTNLTERMRILSDGGLTFNGDTAAANALDDYEEGTWTPTLPSGASATMTGQYTKIGNKVFWALQINSLSGSGAFLVSGLPYTVNAGWGGNISIANDNHSPEHIYVFAHNGSSDIYFRNDSNVTYNISTFSGHFFYCSGFYQH